MIVPCPFSGGASIVQRIQILFRAKLPNLIHPVACQGGGAHHYGGQMATVRSLCPGELLSPTHTQQYYLANKVLLFNL